MEVTLPYGARTLLRSGRAASADFVTVSTPTGRVGFVRLPSMECVASAADVSRHAVDLLDGRVAGLSELVVGSLAVADSRTGAELASIVCRGAIRDLDHAREDDALVTLHEGGSLRVWATADLSQLRRIDLGGAGGWVCAAMRNSLVAVAVHSILNSSLAVVDVRSGELLGSDVRGPSRPTALEDGSFAVVAGPCKGARGALMLVHSLECADDADARRTLLEPTTRAAQVQTCSAGGVLVYFRSEGRGGNLLGVFRAAWTRRGDAVVGWTAARCGVWCFNDAT